MQVVGIPVADRHVAYLEDVTARLRAAGFRVEIDDRGRADAEEDREGPQPAVPFMLLAGDQDVENGAVSLRDRDGNEQRGLPVDEAVAQILGAIAEPNHEHDPVEELL